MGQKKIHKSKTPSFLYFPEQLSLISREKFYCLWVLHKKLNGHLWQNVFMQQISAHPTVTHPNQGREGINDLHRATERGKKDPDHLRPLVQSWNCPFWLKALPPAALQGCGWGGRAGFRAAALICYPLSAEDGADKMLRHLQRSAPDGGGRALGRLFTGGVFHAGKREGEVQLHNFTIFCYFQVSCASLPDSPDRF